MFDVCWADPNRELRSEKAARKESEVKLKDRQSQSVNGRQSFSTTSSSSSSERLSHGLGFFSSIRGRRSAAPAKSRQSALQSDRSPEQDGPRHSSIYGVTSILSHLDTSEVTVKRNDTSSEAMLQSPDQSEAVSSLWSSSHAVSPHTSFVESELKTTPPSSPPVKCFDGSTMPAATEDNRPKSSVTAEHLVQSLGHDSFVTKKTEISISPRPLDADIDELLTEINISVSENKRESSKFSERSGTSAPPTARPRSLDQEPIRSRSQAEDVTVDKNPPSLNYPVQGEQVTSFEAWKPPQNWDYQQLKHGETSCVGKFPGTPTSAENDHIMAPDINALQREVRMMQAAGPELMLANIKANMGDVSEAVVYKEFEMTKKRWMFSALHQYGGFIDLERDRKMPSQPGKGPKILALYESQASASFLAAMHPSLTFAHLALKPLSPRLFPNVQPILVPTISASASARSLPPQLYTAVTCFSLPSLFPSKEIPPFLRYIKRRLVPGGALHLTLIDPQPTSSTTGPKLRRWLIEHVLINLEQSFRTTYPSGTFPEWLRKAGLRGKGSSIATVHVHAVSDAIKHTGRGNDFTAEDELRCLTARMLWQEVWGRFVKAERWWWDDTEIVQECVDFNTKWEYAHILAINETRPEAA
ncbi:hypothetical protein Micbo1qcDRAFT_232513 [Microdochium bolleyi]|uniref:Uncharacterized protein n=1 Tax=Microdochium bolleyi TaxID=196109 RepID=A0A136J733_9PEZI|nr:hypothetical protein Micbo1qcDRAFT_232513 [Microdochium bolleyi]